jgi:acetyl esterase/lipase
MLDPTRLRPAPALLGLAAAVIALDAVKPLTIDDAGFHAFAAQIARRPSDPFGFEFMGVNPAMETLAPLLLPYWLAGALRLLGEQPWLWKLSLLPFALLLAFALHALLRRFARGLELPLTAMLMLSPTFLPAWNLMADLPALALSTAALAAYLRAADRASFSLAALAGALAGLGMLAKYTGFVTPAVFLLHAALYGGRRRALLAAATAALLFAGWEAHIASAYGESHFLFHLRQRGVPLLAKLRLVLPLLTCLGGLAPCLGVLGLAALGASRRAVLAAAAFAGLGLAAAALLPTEWQVLTRSPEDGALRATLSAALFALTGLGVAAVTLTAAWRLLRRGAGFQPAFGTRQVENPPHGAGGRRAEWFLLLWLGLEAAACLAMTPFAAARRLLGVEVVMTLLVGRLAAHTCRAAGRRGLVRGAVVGSALLGLAFFGVDLWEALARKGAAERAARWVRRQGGGADGWFVAASSFDFHAERAGLRRVTKHEGPRPGDWLVIEHTHAELVRYPLPAWPPARRLVATDWLPLRTQLCYYGSGTPVEHRDGPRFTVSIYRLPGAVAPGPAGNYSDQGAPPPTGGPWSQALRCGMARVEVVLAMVCALAPAAARAEEAPEFTRQRDVIYGRKMGLALTLDVFTPKQGAKGIGLLFVASGGWYSDPRFINPIFFHEFLRRGYTLFAVVHGSQPKFTVPEILDDMHRAVRFVRYHAKDYHIDPDRLGIFGASAGGHLALMLGTAGAKGDPEAADRVDRVSSRVQAVACFFPSTDFLNWGGPGKERMYRSFPPPFTAAFDYHDFNQQRALYVPITDQRRLREITRQVSPITHVSADDAPTLIIHGDKDQLVPLQQSESLVAKFKEVGVPAKLIVKPGAGHGWLTMLEDLKPMADWFDKYLAKEKDGKQAPTP